MIPRTTTKENYLNEEIYNMYRNSFSWMEQKPVQKIIRLKVYSMIEHTQMAKQIMRSKYKKKFDCYLRNITSES